MSLPLLSGSLFAFFLVPLSYSQTSTEVKIPPRIFIRIPLVWLSLIPDSAHLPPDILPALEAIIEEYVVFDAVTGSPIIFKDELDRAFFLNLYATVQSAVQRSSSDLADNRVICKPYIESHLLALIDSILYPKDKRPNSALMSAHAVCFGWGKLVPWTWETWVDRRCANTESVTAVTLRWLETIDCGAACSNHRTCRLALTRMSENAFSSFAALSWHWLSTFCRERIPINGSYYRRHWTTFAPFS
ncbi:hypothetical protein D9756_003890 [Leucocoprinus leucothites]|uniref:Uncharacterized protein n=1 Tax=Leucocoprinus leucothites TaxID=201217 RepID=A0A8H5D9E5_9AGAR|nr:hypothetical protein D9756_003890 [Leucoagaricus leucothites]